MAMQTRMAHPTKSLFLTRSGLVQQGYSPSTIRVARCITRRIIRPRLNADGEEVWFYPDTARALQCAGLWPMRTYIGRRRAAL